MDQQIADFESASANYMQVLYVLASACANSFNSVITWRMNLMQSYTTSELSNTNVNSNIQVRRADKRRVVQDNSVGDEGIQYVQVSEAWRSHP